MGMTYEELSEYGRLRLPGRCGPFSMFTKLVPRWRHKYSVKQVVVVHKNKISLYNVPSYKTGASFTKLPLFFPSSSKGRGISNLWQGFP